MKIKRSHAYFASVITLLGLSLPFLVSAQQQVIFAGTTFCDYMRNVFNFATAIVGTLTVVMVIVGGVLYATAGGNSERVSRAKDVIVASIVGMILVLGSYLLFNTLSPNLLQCNQNLVAGTGVSGGGNSLGAGGVTPVDNSLKDICEGKQTFTDKAQCDAGSSGAGTCLKGQKGFCRSTCGSGADVVSAFRQLKGMCIITNHCAFTTNHALKKTGCADFKGVSSTTATAKQLKAWGFKENRFDASNPTASLANIKPGAVLIFKGHTAVYTGNGNFIDATPGWYSQCGLSKKTTGIRVNELVGKNLACADKNPYPDRRPNVAGNHLRKTRSGYPYTKLTSKVQCVAEHSLKNGNPYPGVAPLLAYYQPE